MNLDMNHLSFAKGQINHRTWHRVAGARTRLDHSEPDPIATISLCRKSESADTEATKGKATKTVRNRKPATSETPAPT